MTIPDQPDHFAWLGDVTPLHETESGLRAVLAWRRIQDKPTEVTIFRQGEPLPPQTVRLEFGVGGTYVRGFTEGIQEHRQMVVFGVRNHPDPNVIDTDIIAGDRFFIEDQEFTVRDVIETIGELQVRVDMLS